jgi:hypothetical protein
MGARRWKDTRTALIAVAVLAGAGAALVAPLAASARSHDGSHVLTMIDRARAAHGIGPVVPTDALDAVAQGQSERMRTAGRIFHNTTLASDLSAQDPTWIVAGENVGVGASVEAVEAAFMASPTHRKTILDGHFNAIGVSVVPADDGLVYVTQIFARFERSASMTTPSTPPTPAGGTVLSDALVEAEDGSMVPPSYFRPCGRFLLAEDGSLVPPSFYGERC